MKDRPTTGTRAAARLQLLTTFLAMLLGMPVYGGAGEELSLSISTDPAGTSKAHMQEASVSFPGEQTFYLHALTSSWLDVDTLEFNVTLPADAPTNAQVLVHVKDWDYFWYQDLLPGYVRAGATNHFRVDMSAKSTSWTPRGHHGAWHARVLMAPKEVGIRVFCSEAYEGTCKVDTAVASLARDTSPPFIRNVRANTRHVRCYDKFEVTFTIPDRYPDPFDAAQITVTADFETPQGDTIQVDGFFARRFFRRIEVAGEQAVPQGPPYWCARFTPAEQGTYKYTITVRDQHGETRWGPGSFQSTKPELPGFVRVSKIDPRYFEFDDGSHFFPIGHNIRSPFDNRMDAQFPWAQRWPEGSSIYSRYFKAMQTHGENLTEIWSAAWSLGLEWSPRYRGYHGIGQFNLINAWRLDRVVEEAGHNGIYLNFVVHNHGKFTTHLDAEWQYNPFNKANGGYLVKPEEYFTDKRAQAAFRKLMRYIIARWGYSTHIFAWELWSELDLTGDSGHKNYRRPEVVRWHERMGRAVKEMDPYDHLVATHVSGDYSRQNMDIISLPEMDFCPVDGYHYSSDALQIVTLMHKTATHNNPIGKPVLITEFGGSHVAQGVDHLRHALHAALWASACTPLGGTPLFWWWQLIDEENFYPKYSALQRFMKGEDRRDPKMKMHTPQLRANGTTPGNLKALCLNNRTHALGWIYNSRDFEKIDPLDSVAVTNLALTVRDMANGDFQAEFWDTTVGRPVATTKVKVDGGILNVQVPGFTRDIAFKIKATRKGQ